MDTYGNNNTNAKEREKVIENNKLNAVELYLEHIGG